jgi:hypothetical protein
MKIAIIALSCLLAACGSSSSSPPQTAAAPVQQVAPQYTFNNDGQVIGDTTKAEVACPAQTASTMVAFTFGQSNSANHSDRKIAAASTRIVNYFNGRCYAAADPLLGATGTGGSQWVAMANKIADRYDTIVLIADGIGGTSITRWVGDLSPQLAATLDHSRYTVTHFIWHQGESDSGKLSGADYAIDLTQIIMLTKQKFPMSKFYASVATYCGASSSFVDPAIQAAQQSVVDPSNGVFQGVNTDQWISATYRHDDCHLNGNGVEAAATEWSALL